MARGRRSPDDRVRIERTTSAVVLLFTAVVAGLTWLGHGVDIVLAVAVAVVIAVIGDGVFAYRAVRDGVVDLRSPEVVEAGRPSEWVTLVTGCVRPVSLQVLLVGATGDVLALGNRAGAIQVPPLPRGLIPFFLVDLKARGPLGLIGAGRRLVVAFPEPVAVTPVPVESEERWPVPRARAFGINEGAPVGDDLFRTIRPYRFGDERRRVDWKATARHGELMVRESDGLGIVQVRVVVDLGPPSPTAEWVAGVAAWTVAKALARGWYVDLVTLDAATERPQLAAMGRPFGALPVLVPPRYVPLQTVRAPVRTLADARRRLATTAFGTPVVHDGDTWRGLSCWITPAGLTWS